MKEIINEFKDTSSETPDWTREHKQFFSWHPSRSLLASIRDYQRYSTASNVFKRFFLKKITVVRYHFWSAVTGAEIPLNCTIGGGLLIPHPNGIVIHPDSTIGPNCLIFQQVTI